MLVGHRGGPISNDVYDYSFGDLFGLYRKAIDPEMQEVTKFSRIEKISHEKQVEKLSVINTLT